MRNARWIVSLAVLATGGWMLGGCMVDDSLPTRPRTANPLSPNPKAQENAEKRVEEAPPPPAPAVGGREFPGQSKAAPAADQTVVTLTEGMEWTHGWNKDSAWKRIGHWEGPTTDYRADYYPGLLPHIAPDPGSVPAAGATPVRGTPWVVEHSWGEVLAVPEAMHRAWPETTGHYEVADVKHNPVYYFNIQEHVPVPQNNGSYTGDLVSTAYEVPWFYLNTAALPVLMVFEPPLAIRTTDRSAKDANYHGYLPSAGPVAPTPTTGVLKWEYPFLNPDGSIKERFEPTTMPSVP